MKTSRAARRPPTRIVLSTALGATVLLVTMQGCALTPGGYSEERAAMAAAGAGFRAGPKRAELPMPSGGDDWRTLLRRALVANGDVRAAWFEWKAAVEKVRGASAWPNSNISLGYSYLFSDESVKSFNRSSFDAGFDSMQNLSFPGKTMASGRVALADAKAAGERFRAAKFAVQRGVLDAWLDLALAAENQRLAVEAAVLAGVATDAGEAAIGAGGGEGEALAARIQSARSDDVDAAARAEIAAARVTLAGLAAIDVPDRIATPTRLPHPRTLPRDPAVLLDAVSSGPDVKGLEHDRQARREEKDLADLQWIPDVNPYAAFTGSIEQSVGAMVVLPTKIVEIQSGIATAKAMRNAASARLAQARRDKLGELRATLVAARDNERARRLLEERVLPAAGAASSAAESAYVAGRAGLAELVEARVLLVEARKEIASAAIEREKKLAAIEEILGADLETFTEKGVVLVASADAQENPQ